MSRYEDSDGHTFFPSHLPRGGKSLGRRHVIHADSRPRAPLALGTSHKEILGRITVSSGSGIHRCTGPVRDLSRSTGTPRTEPQPSVDVAVVRRPRIGLNHERIPILREQGIYL